jgi:phosphopantothenoylcysteine decarboxylase / phosphopantothenate---cysteine ligase
MFPFRKVLFKISGSIAAFKACSLISRLVKEGVEVQVVATPSALKFVGAATLEGLTGKKVFSEVFAEGQMMNHIHLDRWAQAVILCPASANCINQMAAGLGDDLVKTLFLAHDFSVPYFIVPAMNEKMWNHPATKLSVKKLLDFGVKVLSPNAGSLACGEVGEGRMLEPEEIYKLMSAPKNGTKVLITSGGTREPIDSVRFIGNMSTGATAAAVADELISAGYEVTYLKAESAISPKNGCATLSFNSFADLKSKLFKKLSKESYSFVIHAAAVSDFSVKKRNEKIESNSEISLQLKPNPKLIDEIKKISKNKKVKLIGFKLTDTEDPEAVKNAVKKIFDGSRADFVVHNDLSDIGANAHAGKIINALGKAKAFVDKRDLAIKIKEAIAEVNL